MNKILKRKVLNPTVILMEVDAPLVAKKAEPGQFIILRADKDGERIPLTVADYDRKKGSVTIIFQVVGATTITYTILWDRSARLQKAMDLKRWQSSAEASDAPSLTPSQKSFIPWEPTYTPWWDSETRSL